MIERIGSIIQRHLKQTNKNASKYKTIVLEIKGSYTYPEQVQYDLPDHTKQRILKALSRFENITILMRESQYRETMVLEDTPGYDGSKPSFKRNFLVGFPTRVEWTPTDQNSLWGRYGSFVGCSRPPIIPIRGIDNATSLSIAGSLSELQA